MWRKFSAKTIRAIIRLLSAGGVQHLRVGDSFLALEDIYYVEHDGDLLTVTLRRGLAISVDNQPQATGVAGFRRLQQGAVTTRPWRA